VQQVLVGRSRCPPGVRLSLGGIQILVVKRQTRVLILLHRGNELRRKRHAKI
jgi:hypothetical protein